MKPTKPIDKNTYLTKHEILIQGFAGGSRVVYPDFTLPAGLRCRPINAGGTAGKFFLDELPADIFPRDSFIWHDATHYGVVLEAADVLVTLYVAPLYVAPDWPTNKALTLEELFAKRAEARYPYASARLSGEMLVLDFCGDGDYEVTHGKQVLYHGCIAVEAITAFKKAWKAK